MTRFFISFIILLTLLISSCKRGPTSYNGYIEGDYCYISSYLGGEIETVYVSKGESVKQGTKLFKVNHELQDSDIKFYSQGSSGVGSLIEDMKKGARELKIEMWNDMQNGVAALAEGSGIGSKIIGKLQREDAEPYTRYVFVSHIHKAFDLISKGLKKWKEYQRLPNRPDKIAAFEFLKRALEAKITYYKWLKGQSIQTVPQDSYVQDVFYKKGEYVQAGRPVVSLLSPENIKAVFFVDGATVNQLKLGDKIVVKLSGTSKPINAKISYISSKPEYTEPLIYSLKNNEKYTYLVESKFQPEDSARLHPGQPIEVDLGC